LPGGTNPGEDVISVIVSAETLCANSASVVYAVAVFGMRYLCWWIIVSGKYC